ncbi:MAG: ABC transporter permease, partial [Hominilimicola sp.]
GKFLAAFAVFMTGVVITLIYPVMLAVWGNLPVAETISCYIGFILLCALILSIGAFMSSITESQIVAAVATYGVLIFTMLLSSVSTYVSNEFIVNILLWLSPLQRFSDFTLGIMSFEPIIYYLSLTGLFLFFTTMVFERRRLR